MIYGDQRCPRCGVLYLAAWLLGRGCAYCQPTSEVRRG